MPLVDVVDGELRSRGREDGVRRLTLAQPPGNPESGNVYETTKLLTPLSLRDHQLRAAEPLTLAVDPGFVRTRLGRSATGAFRILLSLTRPIQAPPGRPAALVARVLTDPGVANGDYRDARGPARRSTLAQDDDLARAAATWSDALLEPWTAP